MKKERYPVRKDSRGKKRRIRKDNKKKVKKKKKGKKKGKKEKSMVKGKSWREQKVRAFLSPFKKP